MMPTDMPLDSQIAATIEWWAEAGVDAIFHDEARAWLRPLQDAAPSPIASAQRPRKAKPDEPARPRLGGDPEGWPRDLPAFREWWLGEPGLDLGGTGPRIAPRGEPGAKLMILVPMPEAQDTDRLLSGREGKLLEGMIEALGLAEHEVYFASALPRHMAAPDLAEPGSHGLAEITLHHVRLARPQRLMVLGRSILPLLGHDPAQGAATIAQTAIQAPGPAAAGAPADGWAVPTLAAIAPDLLLGSARQRAALWRRWLDWTCDE